MLALGGAEGAAEVLLGDDVGGVLRPGAGELEVALLEGDGAVAPVGDHRVAAVPGELVVGVRALGREESTHLQALAGPPLLDRQSIPGLRHDE